MAAPLSGFGVEPAELRRRASAVDDVGAATRRAAEAARTVSATAGEAYGLTCRFLPARLGPLQHRLTDTLGRAADAVGADAAALRATATAYERAEADATARLRPPR